MQAGYLNCPRCKAILSVELWNRAELEACPSCGVSLKVEVFPAFFRPAAVVEAQPTLVEGESSCFYHPQKKAVIVCQSCGRFLCALCDLEMNGEHLCPACLESGQKKGRLKNLENTRVLYDQIALTVAIVPMLLIWLSIIGAPIALYVAIRYRKAPCSILGRSNVRFVLAGVLASLQIIGWTIGLIYLIKR